VLQDEEGEGMSKLTIYMKSGNVIVQRGIKYWETKRNNQSGCLSEISVTYYWWSRRRIIFTSLVLEQIECIVQS